MPANISKVEPNSMIQMVLLTHSEIGCVNAALVQHFWNEMIISGVTATTHYVVISLMHPPNNKYVMPGEQKNISKKNEHFRRILSVMAEKTINSLSSVNIFVYGACCN